MQISHPLEDIVERDLLGQGWKPDAKLAQNEVAYLRETLKHIHLDTVYVYLDGSILPRDSRNVRIDGWFAQHEFEQLPHAEEMEKPGSLDAALSDGKYWCDRKNPEAEE